MTTTAYRNGWADAVAHLRVQLVAQPWCVQCALDATAFAGITAALTEDPGPDLRHDLAADAAAVIIETAMDADPTRRSRVTAQARYVVGEEPEVATEVVTLLALVAAKHYAHLPVAVDD